VSLNTLLTSHAGERRASGVPRDSQPGIHSHPGTSVSLQKEFRYCLGEEKLFIENQFGQP